MVVLEESNMMTNNHNQYLHPDYLPPISTTLDSKNSPLALLAQTCSQIGADSPSKPLLSSLEKANKSSTNTSHPNRSPTGAKLERTRSSPSDSKNNNSINLAYKPYESNVVTKRKSSESESAASTRPASKASSVNSSSNDSVSASVDSENNNVTKKARLSPAAGRKTVSPASSPSAASSSGKKSPHADSEKSSKKDSSNSNGSSTPATSTSNGGASPIIRSGMDVLSGKDSASGIYKSGVPGFPSPNPLCCPPGMSENPAFRPPFVGTSPFAHHQAMAAALLGYPVPGAPTANPYQHLGYTRVKNAAGGESIVPVPVCKDPYCQGCPYSMSSAQMMMAAQQAANAARPPCPSGCNQCDHQKYGLNYGLPGMGPVAPGHAFAMPSVAAHAAAAAANAAGRPHICNWAAGETYCGKRFSTSEELWQHLQSAHTSGNADHAAALAAQHQLMSPSAALQRAAAQAGAYPSTSISPLSPGRYHPYGKPPGAPLPTSLSASPYSAFNPLSPYYAPYALYGQRIGAAVHP
ncbi:zinc finger protein Noc-like [Trichogramma pretiosum]|uniref:zinc finger protein Noc-like n=1 Tax=Trichogramma pretiosum TaxID=7493 RepID=UPI0006C976BD|nr:zinc finger protein Noc-like [Trichogramma pretiosum]